jgi:hypothetical protein
MKIQLRKQQLQKRLSKRQKTTRQTENCNLRDNFKPFAVSANQKRANPFIK